MAAEPGRRRFGTVRLRTTIGATLVVAVALGVASAALLLTLRTTMTDNIDAALELRSADIAAIVEGGTMPDAVAVEGAEDGFVQVVDQSGAVLASSSNIASEPELTDATPGTFVDLRVGSLEDDEFRLFIRQTATPDGLTVVVGRSLEDVTDTTAAVIGAIVLGVPTLVLLVAVTTWVVIGRALRPVEAIRSEVADIGGSDLHRRVPTPAADDEIGRLATTMNEMLDRLEAASERQERFVSDASHELRTPLATIRHELEIARADPAADHRALLEDLTEENRRMENLVGDLLLLARNDQAHAAAERAVAHLDIVDLDDLALVEAHRRRATTATIDLAGLTEARVYGDENQLTRVIRNVLDNAVRHAHGQIAMAIRSDATTTTLTIDDDGDGVAPDDRDRIFDRFTRADDARARTAGGTGLGLAIARDLLDNHGGTIAVSDSPDLGGARFTITLPSGPPAT